MALSRRLQQQRLRLDNTEKENEQLRNLLRQSEDRFRRLFIASSNAIPLQRINYEVYLFIADELSQWAESAVFDCE